ncbi:MAG: C40 family peptidase [Thermotogaceae bacterium]|nr:C40 family peptidase [Thermotogaceae bacterium]
MDNINILVIVVAIIVLMLISACYPILMHWHQEKLSQDEVEKWFEILPELEGTPYKFGGQSPKEGFDCSGLIVYLYNQIGYRWFVYEDRLVDDVSADALFHYNSSPTTWETLEHGNLIFFDTDKDDVIDHVVIFDKIDENDNIWYGMLPQILMV